jgi:hypothetical protein
METCSLREFAHRSRHGATPADADDRVQMSLDGFQVR